MFAIKTTYIPNIRYFEEAQDVYNGVKPWMDLDEDLYGRPLERRAAKHKAIRKHHDGSISLRLHDTEMVTYHPNGEVTIRTYDSKSSFAFMDCVEPYGLEAYSVGGDMWIRMTDKDGEHQYYREGKERLRFKPVGVSRWELMNPESVQRHNTSVLNRKRYNEVVKNKHFKEWCAWLRVQVAMGANVKEIRAYDGKKANSETIRKLFRGELPTEEYRLLLNHVHVEDAIEAVRNIACNMHGVIDEVPVPIGQLPKKDTSLVRAIRGAHRLW